MATIPLRDASGAVVSVALVDDADHVQLTRFRWSLKDGAARRGVRVDALRTTLLPVVTTVGIQFGALLGGAVITESVFAYPGIGRLIVRSILNRDYPVVQATLMLVVAIFLLTNILVDLSYGYLDPSVKLAGSRTG